MTLLKVYHDRIYGRLWLELPWCAVGLPLRLGVELQWWTRRRGMRRRGMAWRPDA